MKKADRYRLFFKLLKYLVCRISVVASMQEKRAAVCNIKYFFFGNKDRPFESRYPGIFSL